MANLKNPTALFFDRMETAGKGAGTLAALMQKFFADNYGKTDLPKRVADFIIYDQLAAVGATNLQFFDGAYSTARSNFPGGSFIMPQSEHAIITAIRMCEGASATITSTGWTYGVNDAIGKNGLLRMTNNGVTVLTDIPLTAFNPGLVTNGGTTDDIGIFYLMEPIVLLGQTDIRTQITFPTGPTTANYNQRIELHGVRFIGG